MTLNNVTYIPKFSVSLLSISRFTKQNNFFPTHCVLQDLSTEGGMAWGMRDDACTIWTTECPLMASLKVSLIWVSFRAKASICSLYWVLYFQFRLGVLWVRQTSLCHLSESVNNCCSSTFELVHSDIWSPNRVPSVIDTSYFCWWLLSHYLVVFTKREVWSFYCYWTFFNEIKN